MMFVQWKIVRFLVVQHLQNIVVIGLKIVIRIFHKQVVLLLFFAINRCC